MNNYLKEFSKHFIIVAKEKTNLKRILVVYPLVFIPLIIADTIFDFELKWWQFLIYFLIAFEIWDFMFDVIKELRKKRIKENE